MKRAVLALLFVAASARESRAQSADLERAEAAFYAGRFEEARALADRLDVAQSNEPMISPDRPRLLLLRGAIFARLGDTAAAKASLKRALILDPGLDASSFPPPVPELVESVRTELPTRAMVRVKNVPSGVEVRIDGRDAAADILPVVLGDHQLVVRGRGRKTVIRTIQVQQSDVTLDIASIAGRSRYEYAGYGFLGLAAVSAAGAGANGYGLGITQRNRANAEGAEARRFYDRHVERYGLGTGVSVVGLAIGGVGAYVMLGREPSAPRKSLTVVPARDGALVLLSGEF